MSSQDTLDAIAGLSTQMSRFQLKPYIMYKPRYSCIKWSINAGFKGAVISIANTFDKNAKVGEAKFDHQNEAVFTLSPVECVRILRNIESIKKGTYLDPKDTNDKSNRNFKVVHFTDRVPKTLSVITSKDRDGNLQDSVGISIFTNGIRWYFPFDTNELVLFVSFIRNTATSLEFVGSCVNAIFKTISMASHEHIKYKASISGNQGKSENSNYDPQQNTYNQQPQNMNEPIDLQDSNAPPPQDNTQEDDPFGLPF